MKPVLLGELFDRLICSVAETIHPGMRANDGLDQALVARDFRYTLVFDRGCCILRLGRPRNSEFLVRPIPVGGSSGRYQEVIAGDDDALDVSNGSGRPVGLSLLLMCFEGGKDRALNLGRRDTPDRPNVGLPPPQQRRADVEAIAHAVYGGKAWSHAFAVVIIELADQESLARGSARVSVGRFGGQELLDLIESLSIDDGGVLSRKPFVLVTGLADVEPFFKERGEGAISERNPAVEFLDFGIPALGNDALGVEILHQLPETLQFQIPLEDVADGLGLGLVDDKLFVFGVVAERHGAAGPFALAP